MLTILQGDALAVLKSFPDESCQMAVTSPPYYNLRDYGVAGQIGMERTPDEYVQKLVAVFREVRRVLRQDGTLWVVIADSYARNGGEPGGGNRELLHMEGKQRRMLAVPSGSGLKPKDLIGIPWMLAFALRRDGWWLRSEITWCKRSAMPESCRDRPTSATEKIFLFSKSASYFYDQDAVRSPYSEATLPQVGQQYDGNGQKDYLAAGVQNPSDTKRRIIESLSQNGGANLRNFWLLGPEPFSEAHFATFPTEIPRRAILLGTSAKGCCPKCRAPWERLVEKTKTFESGSGRSGNPINGKQSLAASETNSTPDIRMGPTVSTRTIDWKPACQCFCIEDTPEPVPCTVLDPFAGSFTSCKVALELGRKAIGIELNPEYIMLGHARCNVTYGLPLA